MSKSKRQMSREYLNLTTYERKMYDQGMRLIAGLDEVGRGPLAGPFVVGCVILDLDKIFREISNSRNNDVNSLEKPNQYGNIKDSKKLSSKQREKLNIFIQQEAICYSIFEISAGELDQIGISKATQKAFYGCIEKLKIRPEHIFTDTFPVKQIVQDMQTNIPSGDNKSIAVAAASIIAKVYRDNLMTEAHKVYPNYGFDKHKGYGTKMHLEMLNKYGPCEIHRQSFEPVRALLYRL